MEDDNIHRLEGTSANERGGLIVKKKAPLFKVPQTSLLGLDKLAAAKLKEKEDAARKMSFTMEDEGDNYENNKIGNEKKEGNVRKFRAPQEETPTYTGGISEEARTRLLERLNNNRNKEKSALYSSTSKDKDKKRDYDYDKYRDRRRDRDYDRRNRGDDRRSRHRYDNRKDRSERDGDREERKSSHRGEDTPRFRDEPKTPNIKVKDVTSKTAWDDDDSLPMKKSSWDFPTPNIHKAHSEWSERSTKSRIYEQSARSYKSDRNRRYKYDDTPRATPAHKYNAWMKDRRKTGATPATSRDNDLKWDATVDRELWEEEQKRLDREWYNLDEGTSCIFMFYHSYTNLINF